MIKRIHSNLFYAADLEQTFQFYSKLGLNPQRSDDGVRVKLGDFTLAFIDEKKTPIQNESGLKPKGLGIYTYFEVDDVDEYYQTIIANGVTPYTEPQIRPGGKKRNFEIKDPDGFKLVFYCNVTK